MSDFTYTPGREGTPGPTYVAGPRNGVSYSDPLRGRSVTDDDRIQAEKQYHQAMTWTPPAGHASWCQMQNPPQWRHKAAGSTPMAAKQCGCGKSQTAKLARRREQRSFTASIAA